MGLNCCMKTVTALQNIDMGGQKKRKKKDPRSSSESMLHWLAPTAYRSMSLIKAFYSVLTFIQWSRFLQCTPWRVVKSGKTPTTVINAVQFCTARQNCSFLFYICFQHPWVSCWQIAADCGSVSPVHVETAHTLQCLTLGFASDHLRQVALWIPSPLSSRSVTPQPHLFLCCLPARCVDLDVRAFCASSSQPFSFSEPPCAQVCARD